MPIQSSKERTFGAALFLLAVTVLAYLPALRAGFIWDDDSVLTANPLIRASDGLYRFWCTTQATDYWPVSSTSFWLEWRLWGMNPLGYHVTNLALHLGTCFLLWGALRRLGLPGAYWAALLFAVHPVNVESVAWIAERKNLLALLFGLIAVWRFLGSDGSRPRKRVESDAESTALRPRLPGAISLFAFLLALLSKGSMVMLPVVLAGLSWRSRRRSPRDLVRLAPYFVLAGVFAVLNIWFQRHLLTEPIRSTGLPERLAGAGMVLWFYLGKALLPLHLVFVYPNWRIDALSFRAWLPLLAALGFTFLVWRRRREAYAWGYFVVMLVPVLGLTDVYFMKYSLVADHYEHLAVIGVTAWAAAAAIGAGGLRPWLAGAVVLLLALLTWRQCGIYRDAPTLYRAILRDNPTCWLAEVNLGETLAGDPARRSEAMAHFRRALELQPGSAEAHYNLGLALAKSAGGQAEAIREYETAVRLRPTDAKAHYNLGILLAQVPGRTAEAVSQDEQAVALDPNSPAAQNNLALALADVPGRAAEAIAHYQAALRLQPDYAEVHNNLAVLLATLPGRMAEALDQYEAALRLRPDFAEAHFNLATDLAGLPGRTPEAIAHYEAALRLRPDLIAAHLDLAYLLARNPRRRPEAIQHYREVLRLAPDNAFARRELEKLAADPGR